MANMRSEPVPMRLPRLGGATLIAAALLAAATASIGGVGATRNQPVIAAESKTLLVDAAADGTLVVTEVATPGRVHVIRPQDGQGFVGVAIQGMTFARSTAGIDPKAPFRLIREANGRLWLEDLVTLKRIALDAFGPANARVFAQFLTDGKATP